LISLICRIWIIFSFDVWILAELLAQEPGTKPSHVSRRMPSTASSPNGQSFALRIDVVSKSFESFVFPVEIKRNLWRFCGDSACGLTQIET